MSLTCVLFLFCPPGLLSWSVCLLPRRRGETSDSSLHQRPAGLQREVNDFCIYHHVFLQLYLSSHLLTADLLCVCQPGSVPVERGGDQEGQQAVGHQRRSDGATPGPRPRHASSRGEKLFHQNTQNLKVTLTFIHVCFSSSSSSFTAQNFYKLNFGNVVEKTHSFPPKRF